MRAIDPLAFTWKRRFGFTFGTKTAHFYAEAREEYLTKFTQHVVRGRAARVRHERPIRDHGTTLVVATVVL